MEITKRYRAVHCVRTTAVKLIKHEGKGKQLDEEEEGCVEIEVI
jgi:hypothetical protein